MINQELEKKPQVVIQLDGLEVELDAVENNIKILESKLESVLLLEIPKVQSNEITEEEDIVPLASSIRLLAYKASRIGRIIDSLSSRLEL